MARASDEIYGVNVGPSASDLINNDEAQLIGRFIVTINELEAMVETVLARWWGQTPATSGGFRSVWFDRVALGTKCALLRKTCKLMTRDEPTHPTVRVIGEAMPDLDRLTELRNRLAHVVPSQTYEVINVEPYGTDDGEWIDQDINVANVVGGKPDRLAIPMASLAVETARARAVMRSLECIELPVPNPPDVRF